MSMTEISICQNKNNNCPELVTQIVLSGNIKLLSGLHIGGTETDLSIGGVDSVVVRNGADGKPYIPGSSLKGKMRCLLEKIYCPGQLEKDPNKLPIFKCSSLEDYNSPEKGIIFHMFGITPEYLKKTPVESQNHRIESAMPTRLIVRDAYLNKESAELLEKSLYLDLPYTQIKTEVVIDRISSQATPRKVERVPAGVFFDFQMVLSLYNPPDLEQDWLKKYIDTLKEAMELLENDYIGGMGSRGYGQIGFENIKVDVRDFTVDKSVKDRPEIKDFIEWAKSKKTVKTNPNSI
ncbi:MAG: type III-A CRISPR-associated RAMP protein Csm3 [Candidatus Hydrogenedentes bacterium]|nr:type III-A CRISPR-associated RAMP protein Csm3 [Candidatus Hydrogenedentota bacterium]